MSLSEAAQRIVRCAAAERPVDPFTKSTTVVALTVFCGPFTMNPSPNSVTASPAALPYPASAVVTGEAKYFGVESPTREEKADAAAAKADSTRSAVSSTSSALVVSEIAFDLEDSSGDEKSEVALEDADGGEPYDELTTARWCEVRLTVLIIRVVTVEPLPESGRTECL